jgi:hypothetical protein
MSDWKSRAIPVPTGDWKSRAVEQNPQVISDSPESGFFEALLRGAAQGATFGFADELTGAGEAAMDVLGPNAGIGDFLQKYNQHRDESRLEYKMNEEEHPYASMAGNVLGGVGTMALAPASATAALGLTGAGLTGAMKAGAVAGGLTGLGNSEAESVGGLAADTVVGGGVGGIMGAATHGLIEGANRTGVTDSLKKIAGAPKKVFDKIKGVELFEDMGESAKYGWEGVPLVGSGAEESLKARGGALMDDLTKDGGGLVDEVRNLLQTARNESIVDTTGKVKTKSFYESAKAAIANMREKVAGDKESIKFLDDIDDKLEGFFFKNVNEKVTTNKEIVTTSDDKLKKFFDDLNKLDAKYLSNKQAAMEKFVNNQRTYEGFGDAKDEIITNHYPDFEGDNPPISYMTKDGQVISAKKIEPITDKDGNITGYKNILKGQADVLETAEQKQLEKLLAEKNSPYKVDTVTTPDGTQWASIVDTRTGKTVKIEPYEKLFGTTTEIVPETSEITKKVALGEGPDMERSMEDALRLADILGEYGSKGRIGENAGVPVRTVGNQLTSANARDADIWKNILALPEDFKPLQKIIGEANPDLQSVRTALSELRKFEDALPSLADVLGSEKGGLAGLKAHQTFKKLADSLPKAENIPNPELRAQVEKLTPLLDKAREISNQYRLRQKIAGSSIGSQMKHELVGGGTVRGAMYGSANLAGQAARGVYEMVPAQLRSVSEKLAASASDAASQAVSKILAQAAEKDQIGRNALIFALEQNPDYRAVLHKVTGTGGK